MYGCQPAANRTVKNQGKRRSEGAEIEQPSDAAFVHPACNRRAIETESAPWLCFDVGTAESLPDGSLTEQFSVFQLNDSELGV